MRCAYRQSSKFAKGLAELTAAGTLGCTVSNSWQAPSAWLDDQLILRVGSLFGQALATLGVMGA